MQSVLDGFNGTIFAYGQTGTGKTFTMQGILATISDLFTARKRKWRRLCFYRCLSFCPQGGRAWLLRGRAWLLQGACMVAPGGACVARGCALRKGVCMVAPGGHVWLLLGACVVAPGGGVCGCSQGGVHGCIQGGVCVAKGGHAWQRGACVAKGGRAWYAQPVIARAVRILLEYILVGTLYTGGRLRLHMLSTSPFFVPFKNEQKRYRFQMGS